MTVPSTMHAVRIENHDGPERVVVREVPVPSVSQPHPWPSPSPRVLVRVRAAGVAFPEVLQSRGAYQYQPEMPFTPGAEIAGEVVDVEPGSHLRVGQRVAALCMTGGLAEYALAHEEFVFPLPDEVSFETGASFMFNYGTAYFSLVERGRLAPGERVLVHGAAGGVGTAAIQVAQAFGAGEVIAVVSTEAKGEIARKAGADSVVLTADFAAYAAGSTKSDIVVDPVGGDRFLDSTRVLATYGRLLVVGFAEGSIPSIKVNRLLLKNIETVGVGWGAYAFGRPGHVQTEWAALEPHLRSGRLDPVVSAVLPMDRIRDALMMIVNREAIGKIVVLP